ncbi:hypothetical protein CGMCC3_g7240 [Colletotrichum fructicola]|uniref:Uncharacterized protein n=2 Tax=Colletotrichum gloeosporioides species complex TaxID=2707338 RepID=A0A7J6JNW7_COLFN|nr:uncharacterized protein CGMCC3_g7240 [Colletotrichum fructicola]KAE9576860.1 hypothetical protein CGMCC3_g7240 [Colletotrichum fructicola]KAF4492080.1 hypothetical protein CGGC5_v001549 [Colletotrichum fructicola Nara gc5]KAF5514968.1 hypothetical protein CGCF413_v001508 [Colletotrichum fructicola]
MPPEDMAQPDFAYRPSAMSNGPWNSTRSSMYNDTFPPAGGFENGYYRSSSVSTYSPGASSYNLPIGTNPHAAAAAAAPAYGSSRPASGTYGTSGAGGYGSYKGTASASQAWDHQERYSPTDSVDDIIASPNLSDYSLENGTGATPPNKGGKVSGKGRPQRRPSNRDEFDGPHQFLARPPPEYIAMQERELPHLPTNLHVQEQDLVLTQVNDRLSQCAYDFVAKYQFPIPLTQDMRPVERPQDREWTEWVYLLKRLATKRRIPARVLYNGQIKQFVTILENSLEMRHAAKHQSRPLKDDRNILQLISAGIQVAKILKDASAMDYLDRLYVSTEKQIQDRAATRFRT